MNREFPGRVFFSAAYVLLAIGFLTIHFMRVENFSTVVGGMVLKGRSSVGTTLSPPQIRRLRVTANGMELNLTGGSRAYLITDDGIRHPLKVEGWESGETDIKVLLSEETSVTLRVDAHGTEFKVIPSIPATVPPVRSLELPFGPSKGVSIEYGNDARDILNITVDETEFIGTLPRDSTWQAPGKLNLVVLDKDGPVLIISEDRRGHGLSASEWLAQNTSPSETAYERGITAWLNAARQGWDSRAGLWTDTAGRTVWDDRIASSILADALASGLFPAALQNVTAAGNRTPRSIGWLPSPYLGNIVAQTAMMNRDMSQAANAAVAALRNGNPAISDPLLPAILFDAGYPDQAAALIDAARRSPVQNLDGRSAVRRLMLFQEGRSLSLGNENADSSLRKELVDQAILPRISWIKDGLRLVEDDGSVNLETGVEAGIALIQEAQWSSDAAFQALGRQLVLSALERADETGIIPGRLLFEADGSVVEAGRIAPETLFAAVSGNSAYPRRISLSKELGSGNWAFTGAQRFTLRSTPRETTITLDFPAGAIHHVAVKGIKPFNQLFMNGIKWNADPNFQRYYAGWYYDEAAETLYVKIRHRAKTETIRILYYDPEAEAAAAAEAEAATAEADSAMESDG